PFVPRLLAAYAMTGPGLDLEALRGDILAALLAVPVFAAVDAVQRLLDEQEVLAVELGERQEEFTGVGVHRVVDVVLGPVVELGLGVSLADLVRARPVLGLL